MLWAAYHHHGPVSQAQIRRCRPVVGHGAYLVSDDAAIGCYVGQRQGVGGGLKGATVAAVARGLNLGNGEPAPFRAQRVSFAAGPPGQEGRLLSATESPLAALSAVVL
jgi:hypothetical protein